MRKLLYIAFTLSGAAGLIYEMIWSRYLALFLGHSAHAQVLVIVIFLGGMAAGSLLIAGRTERLQDPLKWYVAVELIVGLIGLFFHEIYEVATRVAYDAIFPALAGSIFLGTFKWTLAALLILPQSILLGSTFPLMAAGILRRPRTLPGSTLSVLYFTNSLGAAVGVLIAGFYLVYVSGLPGTLIAAAMTNIMVAAITALIITRYPGEPKPRSELAAASAVTPQGAALGEDQLLRLLLGVSFGTAVASFAYEIGWLRMLALVLGGATHAFELMLSAFILGLALGALYVRRRVDAWSNPLRVLGIIQLAMGIAALATLTLYTASFFWMEGLLRAFARSNEGYVAYTLARYGISLAIMFPASFCAGMTLPLITRTLMVRGGGERAIGAVYGVNTFGAIVGVAAAGFVLMPIIGIKGIIVGGATIDMALGAAIFYLNREANVFSRRLAYSGIALTLVFFAVGAFSHSFDPRLLTSGVYRTGRILEPGEREFLFYKDGRTATVSVERVVGSGKVTIRTNGKPDASLAPYWFEACSDSMELHTLVSDAATQSLVPLVALAHAPDARLGAVIGHGSGMSSHFLLGSPRMEKLVTIEIEPEMIRGSRFFYPANHRVFDDPRSQIVIEDARAYFAASPLKYDLILSEPSNPWVSGIASLFGTEFYRHIKRYLNEDGVFGQWLHLYETDESLVLSVLAAINAVFASYEIFITNGGDMLIVASPAERMPAADWSIFDSAALQEDFCHTLPITTAALEAMRVTHSSALAPILDDWESPNSDYYPVVDLRAERTRYLRTTAAGFISLTVGRFDFSAPFFGRRSLPGVEPPVAMSAVPRASALALGTALRAHREASPDDSADVDYPAPAVRRRHAQWRATLASDEQADWKLWLDEFRAIETDLHKGTAGFVDEAFFSSTREYLKRNAAPQVVLDVVSFRHGLDGWDFEEAAIAARALLDADAHNDGYVPLEEILDGGVTAFLQVGDVQSANRLYAAVQPAVSRSAADLRSRLLRAYLEASN